MDFKQELAQFRQSFAVQKQKAKEGDVGAEMTPDAIWADEIEMPVPGYGIPTPESFAGDVDVPEVLSDSDARFSGDKDMDTQAFFEYMENDPMVQQYGPQMEAMMEEIAKQASDPSNPMTEEEAQQLFLEMMAEKFGRYFL